MPGSGNSALVPGNTPEAEVTVSPVKSNSSLPVLAKLPVQFAAGFWLKTAASILNQAMWLGLRPDNDMFPLIVNATGPSKSLSKSLKSAS